MEIEKPGHRAGFFVACRSLSGIGSKLPVVPALEPESSHDASA